ncbi:PE-PGRS family protein [Streptomyces sp. SPB074]|nr:PE-PGRS family protein [Streptomyces sp. SPB074]
MRGGAARAVRRQVLRAVRGPGALRVVGAGRRRAGEGQDGRARAACAERGRRARAGTCGAVRGTGPCGPYEDKVARAVPGRGAPHVVRAGQRRAGEGLDGLCRGGRSRAWYLGQGGAARSVQGRAACAIRGPGEAARDRSRAGRADRTGRGRADRTEAESRGPYEDRASCVVGAGRRHAGEGRGSVTRRQSRAGGPRGTELDDGTGSRAARVVREPIGTRTGRAARDEAAAAT